MVRSVSAHDGHSSHIRESVGRLEDPADPLVGQTLAGNYLIERALGEGGMGKVYLARHTRITSKRFAIKTLHQDSSRSQRRALSSGSSLLCSRRQRSR